MKTFRIALVALLLAASSLPLLRGDMPAVQSGQWAATGAMANARSGASAALLPTGLVLVTGGTGSSGVLATAELFGPDGQFTAAGAMLSARADHASVVLGDGRVLVVGGRTSAGAVAAAETFGADGWTAAGQLTDARWGHTATLLADGRVLIVGGENEAGLVGSVETFDPATGQFAVAGTLTSPRKGHAAGRLADGRVLIAGGFSGGAALNSINIFDPSTGSISVGPSLAVARAGLSATTLLDGTVLFFGGNDGTNDLASAEVFDPVAGTVTGTASAATARRDHQAFLLPNNNSVLIVGGASAGAAVASAELYVPWVGQFRATGSMAVARAHATGSTLSRDGLLLVAGGDALASSETYGFATIKTDKDDYAPGTTVTMTGSGWQPGETVTLSMVESPLLDTHLLLPVEADANGNIVSTEFVPDEHDIGIRFYLTARGAASQAQTTFTDAVSLQAVSVGAQTPSRIKAGDSATYNPVTLTFSGNGSTGCTATLIALGLPAGANAVWGTNPVTSTGANATTTLTINTTATGPMAGRTPEGTHAFTVQASVPAVAGGSGCNAATKTTTATLIVDNTAPTVTVNQAVGQTDPTSTSPINFTVTFNEAVSGFAPADVTLSGTAGATTAIVSGGPTTYNVAVSGMSTTGTVIASLAAGVASDTAGNTSTASTSTDNTVTFNSPCAAPSITTQPTNQSVTYGVASVSFAAAASGTPVPTVQWQESINGGGSWANLGGQTNTTLTLTNPTVSLSGHQYKAVFTNTCGGTQTATTNAATLTVAPKSVTGTFTAADKPYDATTSATVVTRALSGVLAGDTANVTLTGGTATFDNKNVGTAKTVTGTGFSLTGSASANYALASTTLTATANITAKAVTGSYTAASREYNGTAVAALSAPVVSGAISGDAVNLTGGIGAFGNKTVGTSKPVTVSGANLSGADATNYSLGAVTANNADITAKAVTGSYTAASREYNGTTVAGLSNPVVSGAISGDTVNLTGGTGAFGDKNVGASKPVTVSGASLSGVDAGNYSLGAVTANNAAITAKGVTGSYTAASREYNGTAVAALSAPVVSGAISGDSVSLTGGTGAFGNKTVGTSKPVTVTGASLTGGDAGNYSLGAVTANNADITTKAVTGSYTAASREYNGTAVAALSAPVVTGAISGDTVSLTGGTGAFGDKNVGTNKPVTVTGASLTGVDVTNYSLGAVTANNANITAVQVTASITADPKVYDGNTTATVHTALGAGVVGSEAVTVSGTGTFDTAVAGDGKTVTSTNLALGGADAPNYLVNNTATTTANIVRRRLVTTATVASRAYNGGVSGAVTACTLSAGGAGGVVSGDTVTCDTTGASATFSDKNVGTGKTVNVAGLTLTGGAAANYQVNGTTTTTADITAVHLTVSITADPKVYDGNTTATIHPTLGAGVVGSEVVTLSGTGTFDTAFAGDGKTVTSSDLAIAGADSANYLVNNTATTTANIVRRRLVTTATVASRAYNGGVSGAVTACTLSAGGAGGVVSGDTVTCDTTGASATFSDKNVGTGKTVNVAGLTLTGAAAANYQVNGTTTTTADITAVHLTASITADPKVYDGNTTATIHPTLGGGVVGAEVVTLSGTGTFDTAFAGDGKTVTSSDLAIAGADASNYLVNNTATTTANIVRRRLVTTATVASRPYNSNANGAITTCALSAGGAGGVVSGDVVTCDTTGATATFSDKNVGTGKTVNVAGLTLTGAGAANYQVNGTTTTTADITAVHLTGSFTASNKTYDGNTSATVLTRTPGAVLVGDTVLLDSGTATFDNKNVGNGKTVTLTGACLSGGDAGNYILDSVSSTTANITVKHVTGSFTASDKTYDGNTSATVLTRSPGAVVASDAVSLDGGTAAFDNQNAGTGKTVTLTGANLSGADASNYALDGVSTTTAKITGKELTGTITADSRIYNGTTVAAVHPAVAGVVAGDTVVVTANNGLFNNKNVGTAKAVTANLALTGAQAANYTVNATAGTTADITPFGITGSFTAANKVYDGTAAAAVQTRLPGAVIGTDVVTLTGGTAAFADKNVANGKTVTLTGAALSGADASNYSLLAVNTTTANITPAGLTITASSPANIILGSPVPTITAAYSGFVPGDTAANSLAPQPTCTTNYTTNSPVGTYTTSCPGAVAVNYAITLVGGSLKVVFRWDGFLQPINDTAHDVVTMSKFKLGQTIPAKFDIKDVNGTIVQQVGNPIFNYALIGACTVAEADSIEAVYQPSTASVYTLTGGHYQYNWSTKSVGQGLYRVQATLGDGTTQYVDICLSK